MITENVFALSDQRFSSSKQHFSGLGCSCTREKNSRKVDQRRKPRFYCFSKRQALDNNNNNKNVRLTADFAGHFGIPESHFGKLRTREREKRSL